MPAPQRLVILTPDAGNIDQLARWTANLELYQALFASVGLRVEPRPWSEGPHPEGGLHLPLLAWGYHEDEARWRRVLAAWPAEVPLRNPPALLAWNTRKTYLAELERKGVPTLPTLFLDRAGAGELEAARARFGCDTLVLKPQVSAGSRLTHRLGAGETAALDAPAMIQPFLPAVAEEGELSLFAFDGLLAHAIVKRAASGDFRSQPQFGGTVEALDPSAEARAAAEAALAALPEPPLYARIDLLRGLDGRLCVIELELIEPDLYLDHAADAGRAFAEAVRGRAG